MSRKPQTRLRLFIPGKPANWSEWTRTLSKAGLLVEGETLGCSELDFKSECEWLANDGSFGAAFSYGTVSDADQRKIAGAGSALVLYLPIDLKEGRRSIVLLAERLASAGAIAVRLEQSKLGWMIDRWIDVIGGEDPWALYRATVVVLTGSGASTSCGMHAFSMPDAQVEAPPETANRLLSSLNVYQIAESPLLVTGHTFSPDPESPRRVLVRWPDASEYPRGHPCHNPYGVWRLGAPGSTGTAPPKIVPVFVPSLVSTLVAAEKKAERALTRSEVKRITSEGTCVAMEQSHARSLEFDRGYADIDPLLAWAQWQVFKGAAK